MSEFKSLFGGTLVTAKGEQATADVLAGCEAVGIYFSAHWCPPCRRFTPEVSDCATRDLLRLFAPSRSIRVLRCMAAVTTMQ